MGKTSKRVWSLILATIVTVTSITVLYAASALKVYAQTDGTYTNTRDNCPTTKGVNTLSMVVGDKYAIFGDISDPTKDSTKFTNPYMSFTSTKPGVAKNVNKNGYLSVRAKKPGNAVISVSTYGRSVSPNMSNGPIYSWFKRVLKFKTHVEKMDVDIEMTSTTTGETAIVKLTNNNNVYFDEIDIEYTLRDSNGNELLIGETQVYNVPTKQTVYDTIGLDPIVIFDPAKSSWRIIGHKTNFLGKCIDITKSTEFKETYNDNMLSKVNIRINKFPKSKTNNVAEVFGTVTFFLYGKDGGIIDAETSYLNMESKKCTVEPPSHFEYYYEDGRVDHVEVKSNVHIIREKWSNPGGMIPEFL